MKTTHPREGQNPIFYGLISKWTMWYECNICSFFL